MNLPARRRLRRDTTPAERRLWRHLRNRTFQGLKFRRQHGVGQYILDFYCPDLRLAIEIDGGGHAEPEQARGDEARSRWLRRRGIAVRRYWNHDVLQRIESVLQDLLSFLEDRQRELEAEARDQCPPHAGPHPPSGSEGPG